jgi:hypothetical protein
LLISFSGTFASRNAAPAFDLKARTRPAFILDFNYLIFRCVPLAASGTTRSFIPLATNQSRFAARQGFAAPAMDFTARETLKFVSLGTRSARLFLRLGC